MSKQANSKAAKVVTKGIRVTATTVAAIDRQRNRSGYVNPRVDRARRNMAANAKRRAKNS